VTPDNLSSIQIERTFSATSFWADERTTNFVKIAECGGMKRRRIERKYLRAQIVKKLIGVFEIVASSC
jgi:hypothetical protein